LVFDQVGGHDLSRATSDLDLKVGRRESLGDGSRPVDDGRFDDHEVDVAVKDRWLRGRGRLATRDEG
jgi:hypothetical protein